MPHATIATTWRSITGWSNVDEGIRACQPRLLNQRWVIQDPRNTRNRGSFSHMMSPSMIATIDRLAKTHVRCLLSPWPDLILTFYEWEWTAAIVPGQSWVLVQLNECCSVRNYFAKWQTLVRVTLKVIMKLTFLSSSWAGMTVEFHVLQHEVYTLLELQNAIYKDIFYSSR